VFHRTFHSVTWSILCKGCWNRSKTSKSMVSFEEWNYQHFTLLPNIPWKCCFWASIELKTFHLLQLLSNSSALSLTEQKPAVIERRQTTWY